jgi:16S rRNA (adenine1518-N6/adenine1519-N6)-dimethyltransferase
MLRESYPKKALGQHWLFDKESLQAVIDAGEIQKIDTVLEVGPGLGTLTELLIKTSGKVVAVELDETLINGLEKRFARSGLAKGKLDIIKQDILQVDLRALPKDYKVVANIPYYLTSKLLRMLLESSNPPSLIALLVQKEVAKRITASPGKMSILALSVQFYAAAKTGRLVGKEKFKPAPKVDSMVVQIKLYPKPVFGVDSKRFFRLIKAGFSQRRKTLKNALKGSLQVTEKQIKTMLNQAELSESVRAQELSLTDWHILYKLAIKQKYI